MSASEDPGLSAENNLFDKEIVFFRQFVCRCRIKAECECPVTVTGCIGNKPARNTPVIALDYIIGYADCMGISLFDRIGKKLLLTHAGERYVAHARLMLDEARAFDEELV